MVAGNSPSIRPRLAIGQRGFRFGAELRDDVGYWLFVRYHANRLARHQ